MTLILTGTSLIVEWLNVKIQTRNGGTSPGSNGNSDKNSYEVKGQETYQFQVCCQCNALSTSLNMILITIRNRNIYEQNKFSIGYSS